ncbi:glycosyltransferase family A protein [Hymenobacter sp. ASUV-10]|uniref:Glycosyltransferase family A protein n=1 Tax=Hymenobacter aranciens TaxID=3063996 RepID=A0ABT9BC85_9BACT|nr:glycosyltransferase family A protein [Hymenobacter sp. ASUV-10]MDO7875872.1 glycosyltransferase family A protein [Hymenobacter sp. ASUV-10]
MPHSSFLTPHSSTPAPLVTVVALCHNHAPFLRQALDSILTQTYPHLEVWLVDDASTDGSREVLREYAAAQPHWHTLFLTENVGNCRAFNAAFRQSRGEFVIDFATDDVLLPQRIAQQVAAFQLAPATVGMVYSNCELIDEAGRSLGLHHRLDGAGQLAPRPASGWVFGEVLRRYFISTPTMLMRRACLEQLDGYDETLTYEDFDFWVRASRDWQFLYLDEVTTQKRKHPRQMSARAYRRLDPFLASTIRVCDKALDLCQTPAEREALAVRLRWEMKKALQNRHMAQARQLDGLLKLTGHRRLVDKLLGGLARLPIG